MSFSESGCGKSLRKALDQAKATALNQWFARKSQREVFSYMAAGLFSCERDDREDEEDKRGCRRGCRRKQGTEERKDSVKK